ncbi:MAG: hypothetical protein ASARMPREDX12_001537 [Alectoria sarmentosa]|nr:MAG: hypothetical protein ASARMPREDX12_001537 [Alectoria sarmentosa]
MEYRSWKTTYVALSQLNGGADNGSLRQHLTDPQTIHLLAHSFLPYSAPTPQTKSTFDTKTSSIHVPSSGNPRYDIGQIKEDTLWLSKETKIDEVSALRIAVLEWQTRPAVQLLRGSLVDEIAPLANGIGGSHLQASFSGATSSVFSKSSGLGTNAPAPFNNAGPRRRRLLETYLSERRYILKISEYVTFAASCKALNRSPNIATNQASNWMEEVGTEVISTWKGDEPTQSKSKNFIAEAVDALRSRMESLMRGSGWPSDESQQEDIELAWARNQILEMIHVMQILLIRLDLSLTKPMTPDLILPWYRLMNECGFFNSLQLPHPALQGPYDLPLQSLTALISLSILNVPLTLELLDQSSAAGVSTGSEGSFPYILNSAAVNELNDIFSGAASLRTSSPSVLAWSIILQKLRELALTARESKEVRQSLRATDNYNTADSSDTDGAERSSPRNITGSRRRSSTGSDSSQQSTLLEEIYDSISFTTADGGDQADFLAASAVDECKVFEVVIIIVVEYCTPFGFEHAGKPGQRMRSTLLNLIRACVSCVVYQPTLLMATLAVLTGSERYWETVDRSTDSNKSEPGTMLMKDDVLKMMVWRPALSRFPYETSPFLQLCRALTFLNMGKDPEELPTWTELGELDSFTYRLPAHFDAYVPVHTQEDDDFLQLTRSLSLALGPDIGRSTAQQHGNDKMSRAISNLALPSNMVVLPSETQGRIISNGKPFVVMWHHSYSALTYMGRILQCASVVDLSASESNPTFSVEIVGEIIGLITAMLSSAASNGSPEQASRSSAESAESMLGGASDGLDRNQDIISLIFEVFEKELYKRRKNSEDMGSIDLLIQCTQFTFAVLPFKPDRVWPFLGRSGLLGIGKDEGQLSAVVATQEMLLGRYDFLLGCIRLFEALIEDAVTRIVSRSAPPKAVTRFGDAVSLGAGVSRVTMEKVLESLTRTMIEVFESTMNWKFIEQTERMEINSRLCSIFQKTLNFCFGTNDSLEISQKLTSPLAPAAEYIINVFLSKSNADVTVLPLLHTFGEGIATPSTTIPTRGLQYWTSQVREALRLTSTLIRLNRLLLRPRSHLENQMFKSASILAKVYTAHESYRLPAVELFDSLVRSAAATSQQPPSLLGHLGQETASHFLEVLSMLDQPLNDDTLSSAIWRLHSAVVSKRQQWFAIFVLTGNTPRESFKDKTNSAALNSRRSEPMLNTALDGLCNVEKLEPRKALSMLEFVALAADFWPWALTTIAQHPHFLKAISEFGANIGSMTVNTRSKAYRTPSDYNSPQMLSCVADILTMYSNYKQQMNDQKFHKWIVPHLTYLVKNAISPPSYSASLHANLHRNFKSKFFGCSLEDFKKTSLNRTQLGDSFFYDLELANKMLTYDPAWAGKKDDGFAEEVRRANCDLSVVEAQINLFHSWKSLLVELSGPLATEPKFQKIMAVAVTDCLKANAENHLPEVIFERLAQSRADLAFTLLQRLLEVKSTGVEVKAILPVAWNTLRRQDPSLGSALNGENADYYRSLLKILYLALQSHVLDASSTSTEGLNASTANSSTARSQSRSNVQVGLEVLSTVVAQGFRSLTILLHDSPTLVHPSDFSLITAILRSVLHIPSLSRNTAHLISAFSDSQTARCASTLLSWADQLATNGDPIYGELSILFLLELSSVPALAESLAVEGVMSQILSTNLIRVLQSRAFGPFDQPARMYGIWGRGVLPLLLNLLHAVGPPLAPEVSAALNQFPNQLTRASNTFTSSPRASAEDPTGYITLAMASEALNISLIVTILQTFRDAGASAAVIPSEIEEVEWNREQVKEEVEGWLQRRGALSEKIVPSDEKEERWSKQKAVSGAGGNENRLEERVLEEMQGVLGILGGNGGD